MQKEEKKHLWVAEGYAQSLADMNRILLWDVIDFTRRIFGHPKQIGVLTHCQSLPLSDCTWYVCFGISKSLRSKGINWFCGSAGTSTLREKAVGSCL